MTAIEILATYETLSALTGDMLAAARHADWDQLAALERACQPHVAALTEHDTPRALDPAGMQRKLALIRKILADDAQIRDLTEPWLAELQGMLRGSARGRTAVHAYGRSQGA
jgi:flagellar protein FliT